MSLEEAVKENTAAVRELIRALEQANNLVHAVATPQVIHLPPKIEPITVLSTSPAFVAAVQDAIQEVPPGETYKKQVNELKKHTAEALAKHTAKTETVKVAKPEEQAAPITPADIQKAAALFVKVKGRPAADDVLAKHGIPRFCDAKPEQYEALLKEIKQ